MIFRQWQQVLNGTKTQTRRVVKPYEFGWSREGTPRGSHFLKFTQVQMYQCTDRRHRLKWQVGRTYAVQPGRGKRSLGRIRITEIRREKVQQVTGADAQAEGCIVRASSILPVSGAAIAIHLYAELWDSLNTKKGDRWEDNPLVWALSFELCAA